MVIKSEQQNYSVRTVLEAINEDQQMPFTVSQKTKTIFRKQSAVLGSKNSSGFKFNLAIRYHVHTYIHFVEDGMEKLLFLID